MNPIKIISPLFILILFSYVMKGDLLGQSSASPSVYIINESNFDSLINVARSKKEIEINEAIEIWQQLQAYDKDSKVDNRGIILLLGGELQLSEGNTEEGLAKIESAKIIFEQNNNNTALSELNYILTVHNKSMADYTRALAHAYEGVAINEGIENNYDLAKFFNQICDILWYQRKWIEGVDYGLKAVALLRQEGPSAELALAYQLLSDTYLQTADFDIALDYSNLAIDMKQAIKIPAIELTGAYNSRANVYKYMEDYDNAIADYAYNLRLCDSIGHQRCLRVSLANLGHIHLLKKEYEKVIPYKLRSIAIQKNTGNVQQISENLDHLCEAYIGIGDYSAAYEYRLELDSIIASEYEQNLDELTNELQIKYETGKNHERLSNLSEKLSLQRLALILGGALLILSLTGIALFRSLNKKLKVKNKENEILLKEIHHRVKNNLQILSSLLSLQSDSLENENAIDALTESRNRVESMGLIHQRLYTNEDISSVDIKSYITELCRYLEDSFSSDDRSFKIQENVTYKSIDVDYAIPLGLIINELVTNSAKYAFKGRKDGELKVNLFESADGLELEVSDNGKGNDLSNNKQIQESFGSKLIVTLSKKMRGAISIDTISGYTTKIIFQRYTSNT